MENSFPFSSNAEEKAECIEMAAPLGVGMRTRAGLVLTGFGLLPTFINIRGDSSRVSCRVPRQLAHGSRCQSEGQHTFTADPISRGHE